MDRRTDKRSDGKQKEVCSDINDVSFMAGSCLLTSRDATPVFLCITLIYNTKQDRVSAHAKDIVVQKLILEFFEI